MRDCPPATGCLFGRISDVLGHDEQPVKSPLDGLLIGYTNNPLVHQGDALIHLARS